MGDGGGGWYKSFNSFNLPLRQFLCSSIFWGLTLALFLQLQNVHAAAADGNICEECNSDASSNNLLTLIAFRYFLASFMYSSRCLID
jgi:succinate dehydrogenase hydrophobic anchor subunit